MALRALLLVTILFNVAHFLNAQGVDENLLFFFSSDTRPEVVIPERVSEDDYSPFTDCRSWQRANSRDAFFHYEDGLTDGRFVDTTDDIVEPAEEGQTVSGDTYYRRWTEPEPGRFISGFTWTGLRSENITSGERFPLGTFEHRNFPISSSISVCNFVTLNVSFGFRPRDNPDDFQLVEFALDLKFLETPNNPCTDDYDSDIAAVEYPNARRDGINSCPFGPDFEYVISLDLDPGCSVDSLIPPQALTDICECGSVCDKGTGDSSATTAGELCACDDRVAFLQPSQAQETLVIEFDSRPGKQFFVTLEGFFDDLSGDVITEFVTHERVLNSATLLGTLREVCDADSSTNTCDQSDNPCIFNRCVEGETHDPPLAHDFCQSEALTVFSINCEDNFEPDIFDDCSCKCAITDDDCRAEFGFNYVADRSEEVCDCFCSLVPEDCVTGFEFFDEENCVCVCNSTAASVSSCPNNALINGDNFVFDPEGCNCVCEEQSVIDECERIYGDIDISGENITAQAIFANYDECICQCLLDNATCVLADTEFRVEFCACVEVEDDGDDSVLTTEEQAAVISAVLIGVIGGTAGLFFILAVGLTVFFRKTEMGASLLASTQTFNGEQGANINKIFKPTAWKSSGLAGN